ncbi:MAG: PilN domain-containing protein [Planctomycetaceae bacterium]|nr:PilN domain-containing protein [Planctomycetaceae bacterium]
MRSNLGIIFYKDRIAVSQVNRNGAKREVHGVAEYKLPSDKTEELASFTAGFKSFLKEHRFAAGKAVVGLEAGRVFSILLNMSLTRDAALAEEMIRIQLERKTQLDLDNTAFGYAGLGERTFVAAILKKQADQIRAFLSAANIRVVALTPATAVLDCLAGRSGYTIREYPESLEIVFQEDGLITAVRDISKGKDLADCLARVRLQIARLSIVHKQPPECTFILSDSSAAALQKPIRQFFENAKVQTVPAASSPAQLLSVYAGALADRGLNGSLPAINFLNSIQPHRRSIRSSPWMPRAGWAAAVIGLIGILFALEWHFDRARIARYEQELAGIRPDVQQAETMIERTAYARQWFSAQPVHLEVLMELTNCFPAQGDIWLNSLAVDETFNQVITGKASGERAVLDIVDNLKSSPRFQDVKILYIRQAGKNSREEMFAISFRFIRENS